MEQTASKFENIDVNNQGATANSITTAIGEFITINSSPKNSTDVVFNIQDSIPTFTGRENVILQLHQKIEENQLHSFPTFVTQTTAICGMGGVGKTEMVRKYIQITKAYYTNIIWINAESYSEAKDCYMHLALRLEIQTKLLNGTEIEDLFLAEAIYSKLKGKTLMVFDNVQTESNDNNKSVDKIFFPKTVSGKDVKWAIILTTRERYWKNLPVIELSGLGHEECYELLIASLEIARSDENLQAAKEIQELCEGLPIGMQQVIAFIKERRQTLPKNEEYSLRNYIALVNENLGELTQTRPAEPPVGESVFTIFQLTFEKLRSFEGGKLALHCLDVMSLLNPENIPDKLLKDLIKGASDRELRKSISLLIEHNLVTEDKDGQVFKIHRMIQAIRKQVDNFLQETNSDPKASLLQYLCCLPSTANRVTNSSINKLLSAFSELLKDFPTNDVDIFHILDNGIRLQDTFDMKNSPETSIFCKFTEILCSKLQEVGMYNESKTLLEKLKKIKDVHFRANSAELFRTEVQIASCLLDMGEYELAENMVSQILQNYKKLPVDELHNAKSILAKAYSHQQKFDKAEGMYQDVLQEQKLRLGENHVVTLTTMNNLANCYQHHGKPKQAEELFLHVLQERERLVGECHPNTLNTKHNLANCYYSQKKYEMAGKFNQQVLEEREKLLGSHHPDTLRSKNNLANVYLHLKKFDKAEKLYKDVLPQRQKLFGGNHPDTLNTKHNLANCYNATRQYDDAEKLYQEALQGRETLLGKSHRDILKTKQKLAKIYSHGEKFDQAEKMYQDVLQEQHALLGDSHRDTLNTKYDLANCYNHQDKFEAAEKMFEDILQQREQSLGKSHPDTMFTMQNLALCYQNQKKYSEAEIMYVFIAEEREKNLGKFHPQTLRTKGNLACVYRDQSKFDQAESMFKEVYEVREQKLGESHRDTSWTKKELDLMYNLKKAQEICPHEEQLFEENHPTP